MKKILTILLIGAVFFMGIGLAAEQASAMSCLAAEEACLDSPYDAWVFVRMGSSWTCYYMPDGDILGSLSGYCDPPMLV